MRLVFVTQDFPPRRGGIQTYAVELASRLARRCEAFAVVAPNAPGAAEEDARLGYRVLRHGSADTLVAACVPALARLVLDEGFEHALHAQWSTAPASLALRALGRLDTVTIAVHGRELLLAPWRAAPFAQRAYDTVRRKALTAADRILAGSDYTAGRARELGVDAARISVTRYGTDPDRFRPTDAGALREHLGLGGRPVLLTIARLVERKGIDSVLRALPRVLERVPNAAYVIAGDGPDRARLESLARSCAHAVHFAGPVADAELPRWYSLADVFVMPSRSVPPDVEGFGIVYLEAGACERPVVAARDGGVPDAVADGVSGVLVPPGDDEALAAALADLLLDRARAAELGRRGRERVLASLNWDSVTARTLEAMGA